MSSLEISRFGNLNHRNSLQYITHQIGVPTKEAECKIVQDNKGRILTKKKVTGFYTKVNP